ncbi:MAG: hypothetical protein AAF296_09755 [Pseudomonadota bacterium]
MGKHLLALASLLTVLVTAAHVFLGGPLVVPELMASKDVSETVAWLLYFCWHDGTVALLVAAVAFAYSAFKPGNRVVGVFATALVLGIGALGLGVSLFGNGALFSTPAPYAFNLIGVVAVAGLLLDQRAG